MEAAHSGHEMYKLSLVKFFYNIASDNTPYLIQNLVNIWRESPYNLRENNNGCGSTIFCRFYEHSIQYKSAVIWNFFPIILIALAILNSFPVK